MNKSNLSQNHWFLPGLMAIGILGLPARSIWAGSVSELGKIDSSCAEIDKAAKGTQPVSVTTQYLAAVLSGTNEEWKTFNSQSDLRTAFPKGSYREAVVYSLSGGSLLASCEFEARNKEWVQHLRYYFRPDGSLEKIHSDLRKFGAYERSKGMNQQFLVKVLRNRYYDSKGKCIKKTRPQFFNTSTGGEVKDVVFRDESWPTYLNKEKLPFYGLIQTSPAPAPAKP